MKKRILVIPLFFALFLMSGEVLAQGAPGQIILDPDKDSVSAGEELMVTVSIDTGEGNKTNSYQVILDYPEDKLSFESVNTDNSPFNMALAAEGGNGKVTIIRGSKESLTGKLFAGLVKFKAKEQVSADEVKMSNTSAIVRSSDNKNILQGSVVQNNPGPRQSVAAAEPSSAESQVPGWVLGILDSIKNFFSSFLK